MAKPKKIRSLDQFETEFQHFIKYIQSPQEPRVLAIITASYLENQIVDLIKLKFPGLDDDLEEKLFSFDKYGILATARGKMDIALALGILPREIESDYSIIFHVRARSKIKLSGISGLA